MSKPHLARNCYGVWSVQSGADTDGAMLEAALVWMRRHAAERRGLKPEGQQCQVMAQFVDGGSGGLVNQGMNP